MTPGPALPGWERLAAWLGGTVGGLVMVPGGDHQRQDDARHHRQHDQHRYAAEVGTEFGGE
jgi:hypothetical protein